MPQLAKDGELDLDEVENAFNYASALKPLDTHVLTALGVLQFIRRDFDKAAVYFERAIKENPIDHSVWNKYGAALANSNKTEQAREAYK
jgi:peroxin-5